MSIDLYGVYLILVIIFLLVLHGIFAMASASLLRAKSRKIESEEFLVKYGRKPALILLDSSRINILSSQLGRFLSVVLVSIVFIELSKTSLFNTLSNVMSYELSIIISLILIMTLAMVLVEIAWSLSYSNHEKTLCYMSPFLRPLLVCLYPFVFIADIVSKKIISKFSFDSPIEKRKAISSDDISELVDYNIDNPEIEDDELEMIRGVVDLSETLVEEIMTPRQDVATIDMGNSIKEAVGILIKAEYSRMPIVDATLDNVKGIIFSRDLNNLIDKSLDDVELKDFIREVLFISGSENLLVLLNKFKAESSHFAVVIDEHGGVDGIVTMEDILEEVVGEIFDEYDDPEDEVECQETLSGDLIVDGGALVDDINNDYALHLPEGEYDTVAGFIIHTIGKIPVEGEIIEYNGYKLVVEEIKDNRINQIRIITT